MSGQNRSSAVMAQRVEAADSLDDFPTPPWATRALMEHVLIPHVGPQTDDPFYTRLALEPAAGRGHMARTLEEYFAAVRASDVHDYGTGFDVEDFLARQPEEGCVDWVITNPPYRLAERFLDHADVAALEGVALLLRTGWLEGVGRYWRVFKINPPAYVAVFTERVPMLRGRLDPKGSTATSYAWFVWTPLAPEYRRRETRLLHIPPCRKRLEKPGDYLPFTPEAAA